jgi:Protein of unknown function (DUF732)
MSISPIPSILSRALSRTIFGPVFALAPVSALAIAIVAGAAVPEANAAPTMGCPQGQAPGPGPGCGQRAFLADVGAAGYGDSSGSVVALDQGLDICRLMDGGLNRQEMVDQFAAANPNLGAGGAAQVVQIATHDLCPWHA